MLDFSKKFMFCSMIITSLITFINTIVGYPCVAQFPLGSYLATGLIVTSYLLNIYYLIPIVFFISGFMFLSALSFLKKRVILPIIMLVYSLFDLFLLAYSFFSALFKDDHFIVLQAIQSIVSVIVISFMFIYIVLLRKENKITKT